MSATAFPPVSPHTSQFRSPRLRPVARTFLRVPISNSGEYALTEAHSGAVQRMTIPHAPRQPHRTASGLVTAGAAPSPQAAQSGRRPLSWITLVHLAVSLSI